MGIKNIYFCLIFLLASLFVQAREVTDTLESTKGDRVIVTYDITQHNGQVTIKFLDAKKKLGRTFRDKYKKLDEVAIVFFDRTGNYEDKTEFSGINTDALMVPKEIKFKSSKDGYFLLKDNPSLEMEFKSGENAELSIPFFIAHYEGKHCYKVFSRCEDLKIKLSKRSSSKVQDVTERQLSTQTITTQEELDGADADVAVANSLINRINGLLAEQEEYPFSDELKQAISSLREISYRPIDGNLSARIGEVLAACNLKEKELKSQAKAAEDAAAKNAALQAKLAEEQAQARQDSIAAVAQQKADEDRKQNLWLIIGGVILAVLAFIGNQTFQHFRNVKNQRSIIDMQQNVVKRAEEEAKRRTRNMAQSQINRLQGEARRKTRNAINDGINKIGKKGKGNKGISI